METIKKKINALKEDNEIKQEEIDRLQDCVFNFIFNFYSRFAPENGLTFLLKRFGCHKFKC